MYDITKEKFDICEDLQSSGIDYGTSSEIFSTVKTNKKKSKLYNQGCNKSWNRSYRIAAIFFGVLCAVLLVAIIVLCVENDFFKSYGTDGNQHQVRFHNLSLEKVHLENDYHQFQTSCNSIEEERDRLQAITSNITKEKDQLQTVNSNLMEEKNQLQAKTDSLTKEKDQLQTVNSNLMEEKNQLQTQKNNLDKERDQLLTESGGLQKALSVLGWKYFGSSVYFISNVMMNWTNGREHCRKRGAELVVINSKEEMIFAHSLLSKDAAWLGLTDRESEGVWKWVDGTKLITSYWVKGQPDDGGRRTNQDCGVFAYRLPALESWTDDYCHYIAYAICEKSVKE
ncbi:CD209 antigen-like [Xyrauchen texanus]|uniref:CD209 antigen-like n=1 Tax=Xyrauchen texanus TaxID=154827 RepID=UPI002242B4C5|nr:CD209 antigen-like [Xyrauchen texanus]